MLRKWFGILKRKAVFERGFDDCFEFSELNTPHFCIKYAGGIRYNCQLERVEDALEKAYSSLSQFLSIDEEPSFKVYLSPGRKFCRNHDIISTNSAIPLLGLAVFIVPGSMEEFEPLLRHELTHLLAFYWDRCVYHVELLEEGLAGYLGGHSDQLHMKYASKIGEDIHRDRFHDWSLFIYDHPRSTDYDKAASFVKYLIEKRGMECFRELYVKSRLEKSGDRFNVGKKPLPKTHLYALLEQVYRVSALKIQAEWMGELERCLKSETKETAIPFIESERVDLAACDF